MPVRDIGEPFQITESLIDAQKIKTIQATMNLPQDPPNNGPIILSPNLKSSRNSLPETRKFCSSSVKQNISPVNQSISLDSESKVHLLTFQYSLKPQVIKETGGGK